jgi:hypothetical protein
MNTIENRLTVKEKFLKNERWYCACVCLCGKEKIVRLDHFKNGHTKSCGCLKKESDKIKLNQTTHGLTTGGKPPEFFVWCAMRNRCNNKKCKKYLDYGARGIKVCERWLKFENFIADMGFRPSDNHSIERKNNDGDYCPENCVWATDFEQRKNKRNSLILTLHGVTKGAKEWSIKLNIPYKIIWQRHSRGWTDEDTLAVPSKL